MTSTATETTTMTSTETETTRTIPIQYIKKDTLKFGPRLGKGHYGFVEKATDRTHRQLAIKYCIRGSNDVADKEKLKKEAKRLANLQHDNIVRLFGIVVDEFDEFVGVALEYMPGGNLRAAIIRLKNAGQPFWPLKVRLMDEISQAVKYMHAMSHVHRDIKTDNVLLSEDLHAKLTDFELCRAELTTSTTAKTNYATISHMPPESFGDVNQAQYDTRYDIYSFGITVYHIMADDDPYPDLKNNALIMNKVEKGVRPDCLKIHPSEDTQNAVQKVLIPLMKRCWDGNPNRRPNADVVANEIREVFKPLVQAAQKVATECAHTVLETNALNDTEMDLTESMETAATEHTVQSRQNLIQNSSFNIGNQTIMPAQGNHPQTRQRKWVKLTEEEAKERLDLRRNNIHLQHENAKVINDHLSAVAKLLGTDTKLLARCLLITDGELDNIVYNNHSFGLEEINMKMLLKWSEKSTATYKWLATACFSLGRTDLINILTQPA